MSSPETVKVIVRCRPMNKREKDLGCECVVVMDGLMCGLVNPDDVEGGSKNFTFDGSYFIDSTTEAIYNDVTFPLVESVLEGYNGTVFAYGQTGCGKSFTMQGVADPPTQRGIIPRAFEHIFEVIQTTENMKYLVLASYLEIYNEEIRDLLGTDVKKKLDLKEHPDKGIYVQGLSQHPVHNTSECEDLMDRGWKNRSTGSTLMNADSSRSHSIFTITLEMMEIAGDSDSIRSGKLNLVDLAGSERQAKTGATGDRLKEATKINLSLSALGNVISALVDGKSKHIPYRDSKLTRLLQDSLGGNTKTLMVACLSPADNNYDETLSTLRYANRAKNIKNKPKINEDPKDAMLREYQEEIRKLKDMLDKQGPQETIVSVAPDESVLAEEREKVRLEYEAKMLKMKEDMEAEQHNNALLQANMENLKKQYEQQVNDIKLKEDTERLKELNNQQQQTHQQQTQQQTQHQTQHQTQQQTQHQTQQQFEYEDDFEDIEAEELTPGTNQTMTPRPSGGFVKTGGESVGRGTSDSQRTNNTPTAGTSVQGDSTMMNTIQKEAFKRLKELQEKMVGGEKTQDNELKAKRNKRKKYMEKRMKILSEALKNVDDEDGIMIKVYDDIHEELRAKTDLAKKQKAKISSLENEISDLTSEFQEERSDYLETIRKQEQQIKLLTAILDKVQPTIRRDCNYSNVDAIKKEAVWEDEYQRWKVPDLVLIKTKLPPAGIQPGVRTRQGPPSARVGGWAAALPGSDPPTPPEDTLEEELLNLDSEPDDPFLQQKLQKSEEEDIAGNYFKPKKRANELLVRFQDDGNLDDGTTPRCPQAPNEGILCPPGNGFSSISPEMSMRRPTRLEALPTIGRRSRKKSKDVLHTLDLI